MNEYILETNNLCKNYKKVTVLNCVSLSVPTGSIYGLIGENGAGENNIIPNFSWTFLSKLRPFLYVWYIFKK